MSADGEIEFLDTVDAPRERGTEAVASDRSTLRWLAAGAVLVVCGWFVTSTGADQPDDPPVSETLPTEPERAFDRLGPLPAAVVEAPDFGTWPSPPRVHDPNVTRTVGPTLPPAEFSAVATRFTSLVYVATSGRPTVVSLETGDVLTVEVAAMRVHDTFGVERDQVVSAEASRRAFVFHTYRDVDRPGVGVMGDERGIGLGPELCLSGASCAQPGLGVERLHQDGMLVERFDPGRHGLLDDFLGGWKRIDGALQSPDGYRMPEPVGSIWVIRPTSGGSESSTGLR